MKRLYFIYFIFSHNIILSLHVLDINQVTIIYIYILYHLYIFKEYIITTSAM